MKKLLITVRVLVKGEIGNVAVDMNPYNITLPAVHHLQSLKICLNQNNITGTITYVCHSVLCLMSWRRLCVVSTVFPFEASASRNQIKPSCTRDPDIWCVSSTRCVRLFLADDLPSEGGL